jgi:hypothetical protein
MYLEDIVGYDNYKHLIRHDLTREDFSSIIEKTYGTSNRFRNAWIREYMYRTYLIITRQEKRFTR